MKCPVCKNENVSANEVCSICQFSKVSVNFINCSDADEWMKQVVIPFRRKWIKDIEASYTLEMSNLVSSSAIFFSKTKSGYLIDGKFIEKKQFDNLPIEYCPLFYLKDICKNIEIKYRRDIHDFFELHISVDRLELVHNDIRIIGEGYDSSYTFETLCEIIFGDYKLHKVAASNNVVENYLIPPNFYSIQFKCDTGVVLGVLFPTDLWNLFKDIFTNYFVSSDILGTELMNYKEYEEFFRVTIDDTLKRILTEDI